MFLFLWEPDSKDVARCKNVASKHGGYNYDSRHVRATRLGAGGLKTGLLASEGFKIDVNRVRVGSGPEVYQKCKSFVQNWGQFQLGWAQVDPGTPLDEGTVVCVRSKTLFLWTLNPLEILYCDNHARPQSSEFAFAHGTLTGHMLAGEERFSVEMRPDGSVWYEILTFSKPANPVTWATYPIARFFQKKFARESMDSVKRHASSGAIPTNTSD